MRLPQSLTMPEQTEVAGPFRFHSEYDQAYWSETLRPPGP